MDTLYLTAFLYFALLSDAMTTPDASSAFVKDLHKRWFDNVKEYMERKRERNDQNTANKKQKKSEAASVPA